MFQNHADHSSCSFNGNPATPYLKTTKQTHKNNAVLANCLALQRAPPMHRAGRSPPPGLLKGGRQMQRVWLCALCPLSALSLGSAQQEPALSRAACSLVSKDARCKKEACCRWWLRACGSFQLGGRGPCRRTQGAGGCRLRPSAPAAPRCPVPSGKTTFIRT